MSTRTLEPWEQEVLAGLEAQADRIRAGVACKECRGAGETASAGRAGLLWRACGACDGTGQESTNTPISAD